MSKKKEKKEVYIPLKGLMGNADDYHVYRMKLIDYIIGFLIGFGGCALVLYIFFRVILISALFGIAGGLISVKYYRVYKQNKRKQNLLMEFKDLLEALTTSFSSGRNTMDAFADAYQDLLELHGEYSDIVKEVRIIMGGITNSLIIEDLLMDFAQRSDLDDVNSFATIFDSCNRQGGNIKQVVWDTRKILNDKIEIEMEIKTMLTEKENELNIMMVMPLVIMLSLNGLGTMTAVSNSMLNVVVKLVAIGMFAGAYVIGRKVVVIKV